MLLCFIRGNNVGTDVRLYTINFNMMNWNHTSWNSVAFFESGFNVFLAFFKDFISYDAMNCWGFIGIIYIYSIFRLIRKYSFNINISLMLFVLLGFYTTSFNIMRQSFSLGLFLLLISSIDIDRFSWKKILLFVSCIVSLGFLFHNTIFFLLFTLFYYIPNYERIFNKSLMITLIIITFLIFYTNSFIPIIDKYFAQLPVITTKMQSYMYSSLTITDRYEFSIFRTLLTSLYSIFVIWISPKTKNYFLFSYFLSVIFLNLFTPLSTTFLRISDICYLFSIIYMANLFVLIDDNKRNKYYKISLILYSVSLYVNILVKNYSEIIPYTTRFLE
jgi:hypothetical protein